MVVKDSANTPSASIASACYHTSSRWYSLTETAALLGISRPTVVRLIERGDLPGKRIGRRWYVPRELVDRIGYPNDAA